MNIRKNIKKIVALGVGLSMVGATLFGAAATNLAEYPSQYIKEGRFNGLMVVGEKAKTDDVLGIVDIATSLQYSAKVVKTISGTGSTELTGDVYQIGTSSDMLELNEALGSVKATITGDNMGALTSTRIRTSKGTTDADQYLKFSDEAESLRVVYEKNKKNVIGDFLKADNNEYMFKYELQFPEGLRSATYRSASSNTKVDDGTAYMNDVHDEDLYILGDNFNIVEAQIKETGNIKLTLMGGALTDTLKEGESKTYELGEKMYEFNVLIIADSSTNSEPKVKFMINGEVTNALNEGDTDTLEDGTVIGVKSIMANEGSEVGGHDIVSFFIGANKIELTDTDYTDSEYHSGVKIEESTIEDARVMIKATWVDDEAKITSLGYELKADSKQSGDLYIGVDGSLREMLDEPEGMLSTVWDVEYLGMTEPETTMIEVVPSGDEAYYLDFTNQEDIQYSVPLVDVSDDKGLGWKLGTEEEKLVFVESSSCANYSEAPIELDDYFIVSTVDSKDKAFTHILTFDNVDISEGIISFSDLGDGSTKEVTFPVFSANGCDDAAELIVGGESYNVHVCTNDYREEENYRVCVDLDGDGDYADGDKTKITVYGGAILSFVEEWDWNNTPGNYSISNNGEITEPVEMELEVLGKYTDNGNSETFSFTVKDASGSTKQVDLDVDGVSLESEKNTDTNKGMTSYGILVEEEDEGSSDADSLTITIPEEQVFAQVYVTGGEVAAEHSTTGNTVTEYTRIEVGKAVLDNEITNIRNDNLIVVGGPCVNTVAATLLGISPVAPACYENFPVQEGQGIIKMVENGENVAILVAGYTAADTRKASQILANYDAYIEDLEGKSEVVISGDTIMSVELVEEEEETEEEGELNESQDNETEEEN